MFLCELPKIRSDLHWPRQMKYGGFARSESRYAARMRKLSSQIFNDWLPPAIPSSVQADPYAGNNNEEYYALQRWVGLQLTNYNTVLRHAEKAPDLDEYRRPERYPPHPQYRQLTYVLRQHGLFRDEHLDFNQEIKRLKEARGKQFRVRGGGSGKRAAFRTN